VISLTPLPDLPEVAPGDDLAALLTEAATRVGVSLEHGVLVVCQKVVSKAEGRLAALADIDASALAVEIASEHEKDPRHIEIVLRETKRIVRRANGVLICETHHGFVCANAGVDLSNAPGPDIAVLLPEDPDASARSLLDELTRLGAHDIALVISDTFGRPWREGLVDVAIGSAGVAPIDDARGGADRSGRELQVTAMATPDQLAAAAGLLMVKDAGIAAVWVGGFEPEGDGRLGELVRDPATDLFR
jgi:coenzyme F420-0:L-glutamate ligase/coenzyme F420-1:gamma-L-glutamate ligase